MQLAVGVSVFERAGKKRTFRASVVKLTIALSAKPFDTIYSFHQTWRLQFVVNLNFSFPRKTKVQIYDNIPLVCQDTLYAFCLQFTSLSKNERILKIG